MILWDKTAPCLPVHIYSPITIVISQFLCFALTKSSPLSWLNYLQLVSLQNRLLPDWSCSHALHPWVEFGLLCQCSQIGKVLFHNVLFRCLWEKIDVKRGILMHPSMAVAPSSDIGSADKYKSGSICLGANRPSAPIHSQTRILVMLLDQMTFP